MNRRDLLTLALAAVASPPPTRSSCWPSWTPTEMALWTSRKRGASSTLAPIFDKIDTNIDGELDAGELSAAFQTLKMK